MAFIGEVSMVVKGIMTNEEIENERLKEEKLFGPNLVLHNKLFLISWYWRKINDIRFKIPPLANKLKYPLWGSLKKAPVKFIFSGIPSKKYWIFENNFSKVKNNIINLWSIEPPKLEILLPPKNILWIDVKKKFIL